MCKQANRQRKHGHLQAGTCGTLYVMVHLIMQRQAYISSAVSANMAIWEQAHLAL